jgi:hypothetical protein
MTTPTTLLQNDGMKDEKYIEASKRMMADLRKVAYTKGITEKMIAERTGFIESNVHRLLDGKYPPSLDDFLKLADAVGVDINLFNTHK